jgi:hypothetical protein
MTRFKRTAGDDGKSVTSHLTIQLKKNIGTKYTAVGPPQRQVLNKYSNKRYLSSVVLYYN